MTGIEFDARLVLSTTVSLFGTGAYTYGRNQTDDEPLSRIPPLRFVVGLCAGAPSARWWVEPMIEVVGEQDRLSSRDQADPRIGPDGTNYATVSVRAGWHASPHHAFYLAMNNLGDEKYKVHGSGIYGPGREFKLTYALQF